MDIKKIKYVVITNKSIYFFDNFSDYKQKVYCLAVLYIPFISFRKI